MAVELVVRWWTASRVSPVFASMSFRSQVAVEEPDTIPVQKRAAWPM